MVSRLTLAAVTLAACQPPAHGPAERGPMPAIEPRAASTPGPPSGSATPPPYQVPADLWSVTVPAPPIASVALSTAAPAAFVAGAAYPFRLTDLPPAARAQRTRASRAFGAPTNRDLDPAPTGDVSLVRHGGCAVTLPATGPWHELATAAGADVPEVQAALRCAYLGAPIYGDPTVAALRRVEPQTMSGHPGLAVCGFAAQVPRCVLVLPWGDGFELDTRPDAAGLVAVAADAARRDRVRRASARGTYTLDVARTAMAWQDAHGIGCEHAPAHQACDMIAVSAGLQPVGPASHHVTTEAVRPADLVTRSALWIQCDHHVQVARLIGYAEVALTPPQFVGDARAAVMATATATLPATPVFDLTTGELLGDRHVIDPRGTVTPLRPDTVDAVSLLLGDDARCD